MMGFEKPSACVGIKVVTRIHIFVQLIGNDLKEKTLDVKNLGIIRLKMTQ